MASQRRRFGHLPEVPVGTWFANRQGACDAGVHRQTVGGIVGTAKYGAESIVLSGGYEDDEDHGAFVIYTGQGGQDPTTKRQIADQDIFAPRNASLITSQMLNQPVRVVRGAHRASPYGPRTGYRYDGCFLVRSHWVKTRDDGFKVIQYRLEQTAVQPEIVDPDLPEPAYATTTVVRRIRDSAMASAVKELYRNQCQACGRVLSFHGGRTYAEGAHIRPLGRPHLGPDTTSNILCLCPNHHAQLDGGGLVIEEDGELVDTMTQQSLGRLRIDPSHDVDPEFLAYHRGMFT